MMRKIKATGSEAKSRRKKLSPAGILISLGVVYGDIGTSPLYVMKSIVANNGGLTQVRPDFILGAVSLIFWTVTLITTVKYVLIALRADNNGEGGIFALYTLVRRRAKWLVFPAMIGGAALLADGMLTPAVTVTTAIEGLKGVMIGGETFIRSQNTVVLVTVIIISLLFLVQRFGTDIIGKAFGPIMLVWFTFLGVVGLLYTVQDLSILKALNPYYAIAILFSPDNYDGIFILGSVFLATTGAEALYSDMGHVGRDNIYGSWPYVKICLVLNYFGQAVWLINNRGNANLAKLNDFNPFFEMVPGSWRLFAILIATMAAIIASQALISGSYTLVAEAMKLKFLPRLHIIYPTDVKGQLYIPTVNAILWGMCLIIIWHFQTSAAMEGAYGLAITVTMLMTTLLLHQYLMLRKVPWFVAQIVPAFFLVIEAIFFISSAAKFLHGGYMTALIATVILLVMFIWQYGKQVQDRNSFRSEQASLLAYKSKLEALAEDKNYPTYATNLVYMTEVTEEHFIPKTIFYSILDKRPKRAQVYWMVTVNVTDEPYTKTYTADTMGTDNVVNVQFYLGFRIEQRINVLLRQVVADMMADGEIPRQPQKYTSIPNRQVGDWTFVLLNEELSPETQIKAWDKLIIQARIFLKHITETPAQWFGLEYADIVQENVPLVLGKETTVKLTRMEPPSKNA
ncbi:potassium uptake protein [Lacticaseibacillus brantae DSM 23927]|uniref:Probable potassium transport system protein Kup n=2 Tax=Lacticaseibacillus brantae TaxID=943673 RepID=A0A0R2B8L6_9LACO|nr:potassium uptake protein [Lacticaseibacillus brantae DSM 23927]